LGYFIRFQHAKATGTEFQESGISIIVEDKALTLAGGGIQSGSTGRTQTDEEVFAVFGGGIAVNLDGEGLG
jgi:hypothetical protein